MRSPSKKLMPPPSSLEMAKVEMDGMNTIITPLMTPGTDRGKITRRNTCSLPAPRS